MLLPVNILYLGGQHIICKIQQSWSFSVVKVFTATLSLGANIVQSSSLYINLYTLIGIRLTFEHVSILALRNLVLKWCLSYCIYLSVLLRMYHCSICVNIGSIFSALLTINSLYGFVSPLVLSILFYCLSCSISWCNVSALSIPPDSVFL